MAEKRIMMIGAHPDDCDFRCGGIALKYARLGYKVKFLAMCNGNGGHQSMKPDEIRDRRYKETREVAKLAGIEYDVWLDSNDCELEANLENRKRLCREIREFNPDMIFSSRSNDYHVDHRNAALLVQDVSYILIVPNFCPEVPAMKEMPVIMHFFDRFQNPPFKPDVIVDIDDVIDDKFKLYDCHKSQVYEWLPFTEGMADSVPTDEKERLEFLREPRIPRDWSKVTEEEIRKNMLGSTSEYRDAAASFFFRDLLIKRYGEERGSKVLFSEAFALSEYGKKLTKENEKELFPF